MDETIEELNWIHKLPGKKIIIKGNHDYWWNSITKLNAMYDNMKFIQNNSFSYEDYGICGTRGWIIAEEDNASEHDKKIYNRELLRLRTVSYTHLDVYKRQIYGRVKDKR